MGVSLSPSTNSIPHFSLHFSTEIHTSHSLFFPATAKPFPPILGKHNSKILQLVSNLKPVNKEAAGFLKWRSGVSFFPSFSTKNNDSESIKKELLQAIAPLDRGAAATPEEQELVDQIASKLEAVNKVKETLKSNLLNGKWELLYTTSKSILQTQRPKFLRANGKIYQAINVDTLRAQNMETWPFFNQATANLVPLNAKRVAVKFDSFKIAGLIPIKSRGSGRGQLEITYLDEDLRPAVQDAIPIAPMLLTLQLNYSYFAPKLYAISRGNEGNLFVLRMVDPSYRVPT